ncbi:Protein of unknown function [Gryllus bimaculatus]|nr:Protein of unknown function [Gryllus bimaculatus]
MASLDRHGMEEHTFCTVSAHHLFADYNSLSDALFEGIVGPTCVVILPHCETIDQHCLRQYNLE